MAAMSAIFDGHEIQKETEGRRYVLAAYHDPLPDEYLNVWGAQIGSSTD